MSLFGYIQWGIGKKASKKNLNAVKYNAEN